VTAIIAAVAPLAIDTRLPAEEAWEALGLLLVALKVPAGETVPTTAEPPAANPLS